MQHANWKNEAVIYFKELHKHWAGIRPSQPTSLELADICWFYTYPRTRHIICLVR